MILAKLTRSPGGSIEAFTVENHGESFVCAGVSMLVLNTVNSIEALTGQKFTCDYHPDGGYISFELKGQQDKDAALLLESMYLGLTGVKDQYPTEIKTEVKTEIKTEVKTKIMLQT